MATLSNTLARNRGGAPQAAAAQQHGHHHIHAKDLLPTRTFEKQQPIINELVSRFEKLQNKRESYKEAAARPALPASTLNHLQAKMVMGDSSKSLPQTFVDVSIPPPPPFPTSGAATAKGPTKKTKPLLSLEGALADVKLRGHFRDFIDAAYAVENLDFYEQVERYEGITFEKDKMGLAKFIVDEFVRNSAANQVNLPASLATKLCTAVDTGAKEEVVALLAQAKNEIIQLMQTNFFDKFLSVVGQPALVPDDDSEEEKEEDNPEKTKYFKEWIKRTHPKTGAVFYENPATGVTMWDIPKPIGTVPPPIEPPPYF